MTKDDALDRAVAALGVRRLFQKDGWTIELTLLVRASDWVTLKAPWWHGKEVCVLGADIEGNFLLRHCDGSVRYWRHREQSDVIVAKSVREFAEHIREKPSVASAKSS